MKIAYRVLAENKAKKEFPIWRYIEKPVLNRWLKGSCVCIDGTYWLKDKECSIQSIPYDAEGYVVKIEELNP